MINKCRMITGSSPRSSMCQHARSQQVWPGFKKDLPSSLWRRIKQLSEKRWWKKNPLFLFHSLGVFEFIHVTTPGNPSLSISLTPTDAHTQCLLLQFLQKLSWMHACTTYIRNSGKQAVTTATTTAPRNKLYDLLLSLLLLLIDEWRLFGWRERELWHSYL